MKSINKTIFKNTSYLLISDVGIRLISTAAIIYLARYLGPDGYGIYSVAFSFSCVFGFLTSMGFGQTFLREHTKENANSSALVASLLKIKLCLAFFATILALILIPILYVDEPLRSVAYVVVVPVLWGTALSDFGVIYFVSIQKMKYVALIRATLSLIQAGLLVCGIFLGWTLQEVAVAPGAGSLLSGLLAFVLVKRHLGQFSGWHSSLLPGVTLFTVAGLISTLMPQMAPLILEKVSSINEVGNFSAVYRVPLLFMALPSAIASAFYPQLFNYGHTDKQKHFQLYLHELRYMHFISIGMALPVTLYSDWIVKILFGADWAQSGVVLSIVVWCIVIQSLNIPLADSLTTQGLQSARVKVLVTVVLLGGVMYFLLGTHFGAPGAAITVVAIEALALVGYLFCNPRKWELVRHGMIGFSQTCCGLLFSVTICYLLPVNYEIVGLVLAPLLFYVFMFVFARFRSDVTILCKYVKGSR